MAVTHFRFRHADYPDEWINGTLRSLADYEEAGGTYDDTGNGGDFWTEDERAEFMAALTLTTEHGDTVSDPAIAGLPPGEYWWDSTSEFWLIRDWPDEATLESRGIGAIGYFPVHDESEEDLLRQQEAAMPRPIDSSYPLPGPQK